jgi:hypothetical protein
LRAETSPSPFPKQIVDRRAMTTSNLFERRLVIPVAPGGQTRTFEQLIGYTLKGRNHDNEPIPARLPEDNFGHSSNATCGRER